VLHEAHWEFCFQAIGEYSHLNSLSEVVPFPFALDHLAVYLPRGNVVLSGKIDAEVAARVLG